MAFHRLSAFVHPLPFLFVACSGFPCGFHEVGATLAWFGFAFAHCSRSFGVAVGQQLILVRLGLSPRVHFLWRCASDVFVLSQ